MDRRASPIPTRGRPLDATRRSVLLCTVLASLTFIPVALATPTQGIRGSVTLGPTCPVQREGESCEQPYAATLLLYRTGSRSRPRTLKSGADGTFRVALRAGRYRLVPKNGVPYPRAEPQIVIVRSGRFTRVVVAYDTGIR
jgi:hypothetical protein